MKDEHNPNNCQDGQVSPWANASTLSNTSATLVGQGSSSMEGCRCYQGGCTAISPRWLPAGIPSAQRGTRWSFGMKVVVLLGPPAISPPAFQMDETSIGARMRGGLSPDRECMWLYNHSAQPRELCVTSSSISWEAPAPLAFPPNPGDTKCCSCRRNLKTRPEAP